ncbi:MAG: CvpA family protein [Rikenellaceae bacterium]
MNYIDIIVAVVMLFAIYNGWRQGVILQLCSFVGIIAGVWLGVKFGGYIGSMVGISEQYAAVGGFLIIVIGVIIAVALLSRVAQKIFKFAGLGAVDIVLGILFSSLKFGLILAVIFSSFDKFNNTMKFVDDETLSSSITYRPIVDLSTQVFPALEWAQTQITNGVEQL